MKFTGIFKQSQKDALPQTCPTCGKPYVLPLAPYDPLLSAMLDHLVLIEGELAELRQLVEEVAL